MNRTSGSRRGRRLRVNSYLLYKRTRRYLPPGLRSILGIVLIACGLLGFLPLLGFWMIPLGIALLATDIPPLGRWFRKMLNRERRS